MHFDKVGVIGRQILLRQVGRQWLQVDFACQRRIAWGDAQNDLFNRISVGRIGVSDVSDHLQNPHQIATAWGRLGGQAMLDLRKRRAGLRDGRCAVGLKRLPKPFAPNTSPDASAPALARTAASIPRYRHVWQFARGAGPIGETAPVPGGCIRVHGTLLNIPATGIDVLSPQRAEQFAADDVALNFAGTFPDAFNPCVPPDTFQRQIIHQAHATVNLDRFIGDERQNLG